MAKRRDYGDGSLYWRESESRWVGSFYLEDGTRKYVAGPVGDQAKTKKEAKRRLEEAMRKAQRGMLVANSKQTLAEYLNAWLEEKRLELKPGSYPTYKNYLDVHIVPSLGKYQIQKLRREHIQEMIIGISEGLAASTIHTIYNIFHEMLEDAVEKKLISTNPAHKITLPRLEEKEMKVLDRAQSDQLLTWLEENHHRHRALLMLALTTGMRRGELLALRWSDVDFNRGVVRVQRTVTFIAKQGYVEAEPKTKGSRRSIRLMPEVVEALRDHRKKQLEARMEARMQAITWEDNNLVFCGAAGKHLSPKGVYDAFKRVLGYAGLPDIRFHDLRHTAATLMLMSGMSVKSVQRILGHAELDMTMRYVHILPDMEEEDMLRFRGNLFAKKQAIS